jgi:hypothetical protein
MTCIKGLSKLQKILQWFCVWRKKYHKKKYNMRNSGYILDKPIDYSPSKYGSLKTHGFFDVKVYYRYGVSTYLEEDGSITLNT